MKQCLFEVPASLEEEVLLHSQEHFSSLVEEVYQLEEVEEEGYLQVVLLDLVEEVEVGYWD